MNYILLATALFRTYKSQGNFMLISVHLCSVVYSGVVYNGIQCYLNIHKHVFLLVYIQVVGCLCPVGFSGKYCDNRADVCKGKPCFPGVECMRQREGDLFTCGLCPPPTVYQGKQGYKCFENGQQLFKRHTYFAIFHCNSFICKLQSRYSHITIICLTMSHRLLPPSVPLPLS